MGRTTRRGGRMLRGALTVTMLGGLSLAATATPAAAEVEEGIGHEITPGQPYGGGERERDWIGSYLVGGEQVFCVSFALKAPDTDEEYQPGDELLTKWGEPIPDDTAANISYLLLRYGDTKDADEAAALAHLLHSWTAAPRTPDDLDPSKGFREIGYAVDDNLGKLPESAQQAVERLTADANANRGPWTAEITAPDGEQTIGTAADWTVTVTGAGGEGVPDVPVELALTDATADGEDTVTVTTGEDGTATVELTPTGENPKAAGTLSAPAERPYVREALEQDTQRVVSTGGEQELTAEAATTAAPKPTETTTVTVPRTIPAGTEPSVTAQSATTSGPSTGGLVGMGVLAVAGSALVGWVARRRFSKR